MKIKLLLLLGILAASDAQSDGVRMVIYGRTPYLPTAYMVGNEFINRVGPIQYMTTDGDQNL